MKVIQYTPSEVKSFISEVLFDLLPVCRSPGEFSTDDIDKICQKYTPWGF